MPLVSELSEVAICNLALQDLGRGLMITALDENSQAARSCRLRYPFARDACLRAYDWNFAAARASLPALAAPPAFGFANAFQLPADCLFVRQVCGDDAASWTIENGKLLTDLAAPLNIAYTRAETSPASFDALFVEALAARIAADVAVSLTESSGKAQALWQVYQAKLAEARRRDAQEGGRGRSIDVEWLASR